MRHTNEVTEEFLRRFKAGDLVDVREVKRNQTAWTGPHKLLVCKMDLPKKDVKPAAYIKVDLGENGKLERWLFVGEQQAIRKHIPEEHKQ